MRIRAHLMESGSIRVYPSATDDGYFLSRREAELLRDDIERCLDVLDGEETLDGEDTE
jgi:hypothetical protein